MFGHIVKIVIGILSVALVPKSTKSPLHFMKIDYILRTN